MLNSNEVSHALKVVGYWFNEKKSQKFGANELTEACRKRNMEFVKINLEELDSNQKYDAILHKLTALYAPALAGDLKAQTLVEKMENFMLENPHMTIIDPVHCVRKLLLRVDTYLLLEALAKDDVEIFTHIFVTLTKENLLGLDALLLNKNVTFPVVCKPLLAGGGRDAHEMELVFSEKYLEECSLPCVVQSFINHDAVLYKIFVIGNKWFVTIRPSLKNFDAGDSESIVFNSHQISKPDSCSPLTHLDEVTNQSPKADLAVLDRIVFLMRNALRSDLLGIDVVIDRPTGRYGIIDVNPFPSFDSVPDVMDQVAEALRDRIDERSPSNFMSKFHLSIGMDQAYFQQDLAKPFHSTIWTENFKPHESTPKLFSETVNEL